MKWKLRTTDIDFQSGPVVMGILNVTPDSFSDGGNWTNTQDAVDAALDGGCGSRDR
ncbi:MAG: dihydropteroate synthase [Pirellulaceae bacterium]